MIIRLPPTTIAAVVASFCALSVSAFSPPSCGYRYSHIQPYAALGVRHPRQSIALSAAALVDETSYDAFVVGETKELAIKDEVVGDGEEAKEGQMLTVAYKGRTMTSGVEQDVEKFSFKLGEEDGVMKGWQQGLPGMRVGGKRLLRIPAGELTKVRRFLSFALFLVVIFPPPVISQTSQTRYCRRREVIIA